MFDEEAESRGGREEGAIGVGWSLRQLLFEIWLGLATLTLWPLAGEHAQGGRQERARALGFLPLVGLGLGVALALIDRAGWLWAGPVASSAVVIALALVLSKGLYVQGVADTIAAQRADSPQQGGRRPLQGSMGTPAALLFVVAELFCLVAIVQPPARARAIVLATMLSRWAIVPLAIGLKPLESRGLGVAYEGGIKFREFALSSIFALALALGLYQEVALAGIVGTAVAVLLLRLLLARRFGGVSGFMLAAGAAICELLILATAALIRF